jgi:hypothetical protein
MHMNLIPFTSVSLGSPTCAAKQLIVLDKAPYATSDALFDLRRSLVRHSLVRTDHHPAHLQNFSISSQDILQ